MGKKPKIVKDLETGLRPRGKVTPRLKLDYIALIKDKGPHLTFIAYSLGVCPQAILDNRAKDPEFDAAIEDARKIWCKKLEDEIFRRAVTGWDEPVFYQGESSGTVRKHDGRLLQTLAKRHIPEYRDQLDLKADVKGEVGIDLSKLTVAGRKKLRALLEEETSEGDGTP